jgi:hypothetical protein
MINHRGEVVLKGRKKIGDFVKPPLEGIKAGPQGNAVRHGMTAGQVHVAFEYPGKVFRLPPESPMALL